MSTRPKSGDPPAAPAPQERVVLVRPRTVLVVLGVVVGVAAALEFAMLAKRGLILIAIALFLAVALNPAVDFLKGRGLSRGAAVAAVYAIALIVFVLLAALFLPPLVKQVTHLVKALPGLVNELTRGRGPLGFLERKYHVVEEVRRATSKKGPGGVTVVALPALGLARTLATTLGGIVIIAFLTLFMLLEGPAWRRRATELVPARHLAATERIGAGVYKAVSGFVTGNLVASFLAGVVATVVLLVAGVHYAVPLGLFTVLVEFIPYVGPLVVTVLLSLVAVATSPAAGAVVFVVMLVYHLIEGHTLRPLIYGRALNLSALMVLVAIIIGGEVAGVLGALAAIPVAGSIQVILSELIGRRRENGGPAAGGEPAQGASGSSRK